MQFTSTNGDNVVLDTCANMFILPDIWFLIGSYWYQLQPIDYLIDSDQCYLCIIKGDKWVFGTSLMRGYFSVFDIDNKQWGMTPH